MIFKNYQYFLTIVEHGSITKAAEALYISQPSVSKYLSQLEKRLSVKLFDHTNYPLQLTFAGERYLAYVESVMELDKQISQEFFEINTEERGKVTMGIAPWRASILLPKVLPTFVEQYPNIKVELKEGKGDYLETLIDRNHVDFGLMNLPINSRNKSYQTVFEERILLAVHDENPLSSEIRDNELQLERLMEERVIILKKGQNLASTIDSLFTTHNLYPKKSFETENVTTALRLVAKNFGITFVHESAKYYEDLSDINLFSVSRPPLTSKLAAVYKTNSELSWASRRLIDHIKENYLT